MRWPWDKEAEHYDEVRRDALEAEPLADDSEVWMESSLGGWLPAERRAAYLAELRGAP